MLRKKCKDETARYKEYIEGIMHPTRPDIGHLRHKNTATSFCLGYDNIPIAERNCFHVLSPEKQRVFLPEVPALPRPIQPTSKVFAMGQPVGSFPADGSYVEINDCLINMKFRKWNEERYNSNAFRKIAKAARAKDLEEKKARGSHNQGRDLTTGIQLGYDFATPHSTYTDMMLYDHTQDCTRPSMKHLLPHEDPLDYPLWRSEPPLISELTQSFQPLDDIEPSVREARRIHLNIKKLSEEDAVKQGFTWPDMPDRLSEYRHKYVPPDFHLLGKPCKEKPWKSGYLPSSRRGCEELDNRIC